ncbi:MAG: serine/threonine protein phosphatase [Candidatus Bathyarchaeota archaeon]|nr:serine/threonine protein phosphatase [Candidatus Bathyarchaeota archaeon]MDH5780052.1 serine/threonine protein phosphatase [Candidatus Bathyarchaeota archaeon]
MVDFEKDTFYHGSSSLFDIARKVEVDEFLQLVKNITHVQDNESGRVGNLEITGKLASTPPVGEAIVIGDIHGDLQSLKYIVRHSGFVEKTERGENVFMVFLGDYGDRGHHSPEVYYVVLKIKQLFPEHVVLMRGNHEGPNDLLAYPHDLLTHLQRKFGEASSGVYKEIRKFFSSLYNAVFVKDRYIMLHGGAPSQASTIEDLAYAHIKHPHEQHLEEILWSDPHEGIKGTHASPRGAGRLFGEDVTDKLLAMLHVKALIRGHEPTDEGFKINHSGKILTLFSRRGPPYHNTHGAYLKLNLAKETEDARHLIECIHKF